MHDFNYLKTETLNRVLVQQKITNSYWKICNIKIQKKKYILSVLQYIVADYKRIEIFKMTQ